MAETDFYTLLARRIDESGNSAPARQDIYAAARAALKKQAVLHRPYLSVDEVQCHLAALEDAIARLEAGFPDPVQPSALLNGFDPGTEPVAVAEPRGQGDETGEAIPAVAAAFDAQAGLPHQGPDHRPCEEQWDEPEIVPPADESPPASRAFEPPRQELIVRPTHHVRNQGASGIYDIDFIRPEPISRRADQPPPPPSMAKRIVASTALLIQLTIASLAGVTIYAFLMGQGLPGLGLGGTGTPTPATGPASQGAAPQASAPLQEAAPPSQTEAKPIDRLADGRIALPTMFGVYAIRDGRLIELEPTATEPVDPRAKHLQQIVKPARTVLPDGKVMFLVFRRDLIVNAPERIPVRFAARIARMMTFDAQGKAVTAPPAKESWLIRDTGFDMRVMPVKESPEMVYVRAENPGFILPAGRYALMVNNQPYDFVVQGPVTDPGQCVEGSATMRGPVFYECKPS